MPDKKITALSSRTPSATDLLLIGDPSTGYAYRSPISDLISSQGLGTVSSVSVVSANGFAGSVANNTTTPAITISTSITGLIKGNGTAISAASAGTDYQAPLSLTTTGISGAATLVGTTLNIPIYGSAALSALTAATADNTINNANYSQEWQWNSLSSVGLRLSSTSTAGVFPNRVLDIVRSGANANASVNTYGISSSVSNTGDSSSNFAGYFTATGATYTYGVYGAGRVGVWGKTNAADGKGVWGWTDNTSGDNIGVHGQATGAATTNWAGYFNAESAATTYGIYAQAANGTTNFAAYLNASGGTTNYALYTLGGNIRLGTLAGSGTRMVVTDASGVLSAEAIPSGAIWGNITGTLSSQTDLQSALDGKQATLVSGTTIKTVNGSSVLGSGDIAIEYANTVTANLFNYYNFI